MSFGSFNPQLARERREERRLLGIDPNDGYLYGPGGVRLLDARKFGKAEGEPFGDAVSDEDEGGE